MENPDDYKSIGCPKCGAQHKFFRAHSLQECYRCLYVFHPSEARLYLENKKSALELYTESKKGEARCAY